MSAEGFSGERMLYYLAFGVLFSVAGIVLVILFANQGSEVAILPPGLKEYFLIKTFAEDCFAYRDSDTLRLYPEYVDWNSFSQENMVKCYASHNDDIAFRLTLTRREPGLTPITKPAVKTQNWNDDIATKKIATKQVLVYDNKNMYDGDLKIEMQNV